MFLCFLKLDKPLQAVLVWGLVFFFVFFCWTIILNLSVVPYACVQRDPGYVLIKACLRVAEPPADHNVLWRPDADAPLGQEKRAWCCHGGQAVGLRLGLIGFLLRYVCVSVGCRAAGMLVFAKWRELQRLSKHTSVCQLGTYCCLCAGSLSGGTLNGASCAEREESWPLRLEDDNA